MHKPLSNSLAHFGSASTLPALHGLDALTPPHTVWRTPLGAASNPGFAAPGPITRLLGRLRRLRARWRRQLARHGVRRIDL